MIFLIALVAVVPLGTFADISCPDSSKCPNNSTCCALNTGSGFGCCPVLGGVCCKWNYCCDVGEICGNPLKKCINTLASSKSPFGFVRNAVSKPTDVPCPPAPGGSCPDGQTCCRTGCCPLPNAVCCSDGMHCCPEGTICDSSGIFCIGSNGLLPSTESTSFRPEEVPCLAAPCGSCQDGQTCCPSGCCPLPSAVCCNDGKHCCPQNTVCYSSGSEMLCIDSKGALPSANRVSLKPKHTPCPGGGTCPGDDTCCANGCCPLPDGVCCNDGLHCCPANTVCDEETGYCTGSSLLNLKSKIRRNSENKALKPAVRVGVNIVYCPGGKYYCPDYNTCCLLPSGQWGCCPYPTAVCCPDKVHCCPAGTYCGPTSTTCRTSTNETAASKKFSARLLGNH